MWAENLTLYILGGCIMTCLILDESDGPLSNAVLLTGFLLWPIVLVIGILRAFLDARR